MSPSASGVRRFLCFVQCRERSAQDDELDPGAYSATLIRIFNDRATARVSDTSSVLARDVVVWIFFAAHISQNANPGLYECRKLQRIAELFHNALPSDPNVLIDTLADSEWGQLQ
jgi:hypothetical protein